MKNNIRILLLLSGLCLSAALAQAAAIYQVSVNLPTIPGTGWLDFQFNQANALTSLAATATVSGFQSTGFTFGPTADTSTGVSGTLGGGFSIPNDQSAANYFTQQVAGFGSAFSFLVTLDGPALGGGAADGSGFYVSLLADDYSPIVGNLPNGELGNILLAGDGTLATNVSFFDVGFVKITQVPEPGFGWLLLAGGAAVAAWRRGR